MQNPRNVLVAGSKVFLKHLIGCSRGGTGFRTQTKCVSLHVQHLPPVKGSEQASFCRSGCSSCPYPARRWKNNLTANHWKIVQDERGSPVKLHCPFVYWCTTDWIGHRLGSIMQMPMTAKASQTRLCGGHHPHKYPTLSVFSSLHPLLLSPMHLEG